MDEDLEYSVWYGNPDDEPHHLLALVKNLRHAIIIADYERARYYNNGPRRYRNKRRENNIYIKREVQHWIAAGYGPHFYVGGEWTDLQPEWVYPSGKTV